MRPTNKTILANIKRLAKKRGKTLSSLSLELGRSTHYLSVTLTQKKKLVSLELLLSLSELLSCNIMDLIRVGPPMEKEEDDHQET